MEEEADIFPLYTRHCMSINGYKSDFRNYRTVITYLCVCYREIMPCHMHVEDVDTGKLHR